MSGPPTLPQVPIGTPLGDRSYESLNGQDAVNAASLQRTAFEDGSSSSSPVAANNPFRGDNTAGARMADPSSGSVLPSSGGVGHGITTGGRPAGVDVPSYGTGHGVSEGFTGGNLGGGASLGSGRTQPDLASSGGIVGPRGANSGNNDLASQAKSSLDNLTSSSTTGNSNLSQQTRSTIDDLGNKAGIQGQPSARAENLAGQAKSQVDDVANKLANTNINDVAQSVRPTETPDPVNLLSALAGAAVSAPGAAIAALQGKLNEVGPADTRYGDQAANVAGVVKTQAVNATNALVNALPDAHTKETDGTPRSAAGIAGSLASATANQVHFGAAKVQPYLPGSAEEARQQLAQAAQTAGQYVPASVSQTLGSVKQSSPITGDASRSTTTTGGQTTDAIHGQTGGIAAQAQHALENVKATVASYLPASLGGGSVGSTAAVDSSRLPTTTGGESANASSTSIPTSSQVTKGLSHDAPTPSSLHATPGDRTAGAAMPGNVPSYSASSAPSSHHQSDLHAALAGSGGATSSVNSGFTQQQAGAGGLPPPLPIDATQFDRRTGGNGGPPTDAL